MMVSLIRGVNDKRDEVTCGRGTAVFLQQPHTRSCSSRILEVWIISKLLCTVFICKHHENTKIDYRCSLQQ